jgi:hypothetical protein
MRKLMVGIVGLLFLGWACLTIIGGLHFFQMDAQLEALGDLRNRMQFLEDQAVNRWLAKVVLLTAVPLLGLVLLAGLVRATRRVTAPVALPVAVAAPQKSAPAASGLMFRFAAAGACMVLAALGYGAMRGWHDYRRAQAELEVLLPFYEDRVQRLGAAHATEREAMMAWEAVNEQYVALLTTNEEKKAREVAPRLVTAMKALVTARQSRRTEELVVDSVAHDLLLYRRLADQACPWRLWNDASRTAIKVAN